MKTMGKIVVSAVTSFLAGFAYSQGQAWGRVLSPTKVAEAYGAAVDRIRTLQEARANFRE